jgi:hypothetical protein
VRPVRLTYVDAEAGEGPDAAVASDHYRPDASGHV